jgi:hypothetical protein
MRLCWTEKIPLVLFGLLTVVLTAQSAVTAFELFGSTRTNGRGPSMRAMSSFQMARLRSACSGDISVSS